MAMCCFSNVFFSRLFGFGAFSFQFYFHFYFVVSFSILVEHKMKRAQRPVRAWSMQHSRIHARQPSSPLLAGRVRLTASVEGGGSASTFTATLVLKRGYKPLNPYAVDFRLSPTDALNAFDKFHKQSWLSPLMTTLKTSSDVRPVFLPFWVFEASVKGTVSGEVPVPHFTLLYFFKYILFILKSINSPGWPPRTSPRVQHSHEEDGDESQYAVATHQQAQDVRPRPAAL
jgi:hypothetical protein